MKPRDDDVSRNWEITGSVLTLRNVKKGIAGSGDNAVYQCKAENKHGYLWANFYLNLLGNRYIFSRKKKTIMTQIFLKL